MFGFLKRIWVFSFFRRIWLASTYYNKEYGKIFKWGVQSKEHTNFTYDLTSVNMRYLAHTVSIIAAVQYDTVLGYFDEILNDKVVKETIMEAMKKSPERRYADKEIRYGRRLGWYAFVRAMKPKVVVETGVDKGLGSVLLCAALLRNKEEGHPGQFFGTDINPKAGYFLSGKYAEIGEILYGDSIETLSQFQHSIDLFINDSDHSADYEYREYLTIKDKLSKQAIILGDNAHCTAKLADFSKETGRKFLFFQEKPADHWYPGSGIGISY